MVNTTSIARFLLALFISEHLLAAASGKVVLSVCQGPFCSNYGCKNVLRAASQQKGMAGKARGCFGKQGCETAFPKKGVTVTAPGLGAARTLPGCASMATAKSQVGAIAKAYGL